MHRRRDIYGEDANEFRPERWEDPDFEKRVGWGFVSFHGGPRICLGSKYTGLLNHPLQTDNANKCLAMHTEDFALTEASCVITRLIQAFPNIRLPPEIEVERTGQEKQCLTIVVSSAEGCKVLLE